MKKLLYWENAETINILKNSLKNDNISVVSTDTVLGLLGNVSLQSAQKLDKIKKRNEKSYIVLIDSIEKLNNFVDVDKLSQQLNNLMSNCWPGPLTLIFNLKNNAPEILKNSDNSIAVRVPEHKYLLELLQHFDGLFSTSANLSGMPVAQHIQEIDASILNSIDYVVVDQNKKNDGYSSLASTILDCRKDKIALIRQGAFSIDELKKYL